MEREKKLVKNITKGKDLEESLPQYANVLAKDYYNHGLLQLTMEYYTLYEVVADKNPIILGLSDELAQINTMIANITNFKINDQEKNIKEIDDFRKKMLHNMNELTYYADCMLTYDYILERISGRFNEEKEEFDEKEFSEEVIRYIFTGKDNMIKNERIKEVIQQLPLRMTKSKYFELVNNSINLYKGADKSSLESYLYLFRTCAMIYKRDGNILFPELEKSMLLFKNQNYNEITKEEYNKLESTMSECMDYIEQAQTVYIQVQTLINHLYGMMLSAPYVVEDDNTAITCKKILNALLEKFQKDEYVEVPEEIIALMNSIVGEQEKNYQKFSFLEGILYEIQETHGDLIKSLMLDTLFNNLYRIQQLYTSSIFIDFEEKETKGIVEDSDIKIAQDNLIKVMTKHFESESRWVKRAIMAHTMYAMPVFFNTPDEVSEYIISSLEQCHDKDEKIASMKEIKSMIAEANNY